MHALVLAEVLDIVQARRGIDLHGYRVETLERGLMRRLEVTGEDTGAYLARLRADDKELDALLSSVLIGVTEMFRDSDVWDALRRVVLPALSVRGPIRAWSIGCATGEEAWSLALLLQAAGAPWEIVATDIDPRALDAAEKKGVDLPEHVRARVRFARHDIAGDRVAPKEAVVAAFELVLLRNVLIYFRPPLQDRVLMRLSSVVLPGGALVVGPAEETTLPAFEPWPGVAPRLRIYRRSR